MTEKEFDIQVRSLLQNAEESVSPQVWEGVASRLQRGRRAVVVRRYWGAFAGVAFAAAAAVALFVLLRPSMPQAVPSVEPSPAILAQVTPAPEAEMGSFTPELQTLPETPRRPKAVAPAASMETLPSLVEGIPSNLLYSAVSGGTRERIAPRAVQPVSVQEPDPYLFNRLALEEEQPMQRGLSLLASGNFQTTQRASASALSGPRFGAPPAGAGVGIYDESPEVSFGFPFSAGIGVRYAFAQDWAIGTGVRYTNLSRTFVGDYVGDGFMVLQADIDNSQHWLGIPLNLYYGLVNRGSWRVHSFVGATCEYLMDNHYLVHNSPKDIHYSQNNKPLQWSAAIGLGVEYQVTPWLGIYMDPNFRYYFRTDLQPRSIRTIQPLRFDLEIGLRFSL